MFRLRRLALIPLFLIGLPLFIYLGFIRDEPILEVDYDVELGRQSARAIGDRCERARRFPARVPLRRRGLAVGLRGDRVAASSVETRSI